MKTILRWFLASSILLLALTPLQGTLAQTEQVHLRITQVDNSNFPQVTIYVSATDDNGQPVGVDPQKLQIVENGQVMQPDQVSGLGEIGSLTVLLVMDVSGSMNNGGKLEGAKAAAQAFVDQMRPGDQAGLLTFNTQVTYQQPVTGDHTVLDQAIQGLTAVNDTAMYDALVEAVQILQEYSGRKAILVLTDGMDNQSQHTTDNVIDAIGAGGLSISMVGLGDPQNPNSFFGLDETALKSLAERAGGVYSYASSPDALRGIYELYGQALQSEYRITYTSPLTLRDGLTRSLTISLDGTVSGEADYNPGGVLPEVPRSLTWTVFFAALAGLVLLLFIPAIVRLIGGKKPPKKSRIKLH